ncbi:MAG: hypothetical protein HKP25_09340 [Marinicaulis sp.]|nr:hypothetical protein [Marinicaulis sp.]NNL89263.1 hypothetical protein [Marinicaulis sp.]
MRIVEIGLVLLLALLLTRMAFVLFAPIEMPEIEIAQSSGAAKETIVRSPFPAADIEAPAAAVVASPDEVAETTLNMTLMGVWPDGDIAGEGTAIIKKPDNSQGAFSNGDEIVNGVSLDAVYHDRVILLRNGLREALPFENLPQRKTSAPSRRTASAGLQTNAARRIASAGGVTDIFRITPRAGADGNIMFQLTSGPNRAAFTRLGLKNGDELVSINGAAPPTTPAEIQNFVRSLQNEQNATVMVKRGDEVVMVPVDLAQFRNQ